MNEGSRASSMSLLLCSPAHEFRNIIKLLEIIHTILVNLQNIIFLSHIQNTKKIWIN